MAEISAKLKDYKVKSLKVNLLNFTNSKIPGGNCIGYGRCKGAIVSSMTFLLGKYLTSLRGRSPKQSVNTDRFRQGKKDDAVIQLHHGKMVIFSTALPAGYSNGGTSNNLGTNANFWTVTENDATNAWNRNLNTGNAQSNRNNNNKTNGFSVRCLQNWLFKNRQGSIPEQCDPVSLSNCRRMVSVCFFNRMTMNVERSEIPILRELLNDNE